MGTVELLETTSHTTMPLQKAASWSMTLYMKELASAVNHVSALLIYRLARSWIDMAWKHRSIGSVYL